MPSTQVAIAPVAIIQTDPISFVSTRGALLALGLKECEDFVMDSMDIKPVTDSLFANIGEMRLIVTGTFPGGSSEAARKFIGEMRAKNPSIAVWFFSMFAKGGEPGYERSFDSSDHERYDTLAQAIREFLGK